MRSQRGDFVKRRGLERYACIVWVYEREYGWGACGMEQDRYSFETSNPKHFSGTEDKPYFSKAWTLPVSSLAVNV